MADRIIETVSQTALRLVELARQSLIEDRLELATLVEVIEAHDFYSSETRRLLFQKAQRIARQAVRLSAQAEHVLDETLQTVEDIGNRYTESQGRVMMLKSEVAMLRKCLADGTQPID